MSVELRQDRTAGSLIQPASLFDAEEKAVQAQSRYLDVFKQYKATSEKTMALQRKTVLELTQGTEQLKAQVNEMTTMQEALLAKIAEQAQLLQQLQEKVEKQNAELADYKRKEQLTLEAIDLALKDHAGPRRIQWEQEANCLERAHQNLTAAWGTFPYVRKYNI